MAIVGAASRAQNPCGLATRRLHAARSRARTSGLLAACAVLVSISVAGCARNPAPREVQAAPRETRASPVRAAMSIRRHSEPRRYSEPRIHRPDPALLAAQPAPDCEFRRSDLETVDPDQWARLKAEYERQCYQDAEKAARDRLSSLQSAATCEIEPVPQRASVR